MSNIASYQKAAARAEDAWLGQLCWYSIPEETVNHDAVLQLCKQHDLEKYAPSAPRAPDVFRRVCKDSERKLGTKEDDERLFYSFKSIDKDEHEILVKLVRETVDARNRAIDWAQQANITFKRTSHTIGAVELPDIDDVGRDIIATLRSAFRNENGKINSAHLRRMIQQVLGDCMATAVRPSGGIYFVQQSYHDKLGKLRAVVDSIPNGATFHTLPLLDLDDQRAMLKAAVEGELASDIDGRLAEIQDLLSGSNPITEKQFVNLSAALHKASRKGAEYSDLLETTLDTFNQRKKLANNAISSLANLVEY